MSKGASFARGVLITGAIVLVLVDVFTDTPNTDLFIMMCGYALAAIAVKYVWSDSPPITEGDKE